MLQPAFFYFSRSENEANKDGIFPGSSFSFAADNRLATSPLLTDRWLSSAPGDMLCGPLLYGDLLLFEESLISFDTIPFGTGLVNSSMLLLLDLFGDCRYSHLRELLPVPFLSGKSPSSSSKSLSTGLTLNSSSSFSILFCSSSRRSSSSCLLSRSFRRRSSSSSSSRSCSSSSF